MKITILSPGRFRNDLLGDLYKRYITRLSWSVTLVEVEPKRRETETAALLRHLPDAGAVIALDERGKVLTSPAFAALLSDFQQSHGGVVTIMIGGADGLGDLCRQRADIVLSLSAMTWPHMMVRTMLAEQLYRAETLLKGHPYHR